MKDLADKVLGDAGFYKQSCLVAIKDIIASMRNVFLEKS
ncbi:MAG: hypothetical protein MPEBLZ_03595 [Candidatus Methanoperedens nitroreducens]|uniref:Uncharacterized protein n=1 Tax=Candidatus Methanoperedens nitratireducens TaxID=1392998 RepID=A0A0P8CGP4_9EURY|nr:MAG: hypothetical protein MPEBLZ_03595 [Candidatus Methanoperedens sp. BLZ1]CAG0999386.1 hypothetical protein METP2_03149 [Methanosarcinales archaeon]